ncbi:MAG: hypothetical protein U5J78_01900 [Parasphingorhabdus sp.]|nr:hypothetical protein [Parasphingorhabdus sp.]
MVLRLKCLTGYIFAVLAGLLFMVLANAPAQYIAANAGALVLGIAIVLLSRPFSSKMAVIFISVMVAAMLLTLLGIGQEGVRRWLSLGPFNLHAAMLLLPAFFAIILRIDRRLAFLAVASVAAIVAGQPDRASALALLFGTSVLAYTRREPLDLGMVAVSGFAVAVTLIRNDPLEPVRFVEGVIFDSWHTHPLYAILLAIALLWAVSAIAIHNQTSSRAAAIAVMACFAGFIIASFVGAYPVPLIGYGVSSIIGYGLAFGILQRGYS